MYILKFEWVEDTKKEKRKEKKKNKGRDPSLPG